MLLIDSRLLARMVDENKDLMAHCLKYAARKWLEAARPDVAEFHEDYRIHQHLLSLANMKDGQMVIEEMPRHAQLAEKCGMEDREAAAAIALLIEKGIVRREYPALIIENVAALRASSL